MEKVKASDKILFSPIGDTDPVRDFYDGACLHIVRHYHPSKVILFYTRDESEKDPIMIKAIKDINNKCDVLKSIKTEIEKPHLFDEFRIVLPEAVNKIHEQYPEAEILLNLSSGTPAIKGILAILSVEMEFCRGIQVSTPRKGSNKSNFAALSVEETLIMLEENHDNSPESPNRCTEPDLQIIRYYSEKNRVLTLIDHYEYRGAWYLARNSDNIPKTVKALLEHAMLRAELLSDEAKAVMNKYAGKVLFPFKDKPESLVEYFQLMQIAQKKKRLSDLLLKITPFMYELIFFYLENMGSKLPFSFKALCKKEKHTHRLIRNRLKAAEPELLRFLDCQFDQPFRDSDLSFLLLRHICAYIKENELLPEGDRELHTIILDNIDKVVKANGLRNDTAHKITNVQEEDFKDMVGRGSNETLMILFTLLKLIIDERKIQNFGNIYDNINTWIKDELIKSECNLGI